MVKVNQPNRSYYCQPWGNIQKLSEQYQKENFRKFNEQMEWRYCIQYLIDYIVTPPYIQSICGYFQEKLMPKSKQPKEGRNKDL